LKVRICHKIVTIAVCNHQYFDESKQGRVTEQVPFVLVECEHMWPFAAAIEALVVHHNSEDQVVEAPTFEKLVAFSICAPKVVEDLWEVVVRVHLSADWFAVFEMLAVLRPDGLYGLFNQPIYLLQ
jgi:hypothetical protein